MSRTDHHAPDWVRGMRANQRSAYHHPNCDAGLGARACRWRPSDGSHPCDLEGPHPNNRNAACVWVPEDRFHRWYLSGPVKVRINLGYYSPERAHVRDTLRSAARDYTANGEIDIEPISRQGHRSPGYSGYWD